MRRRSSRLTRTTRGCSPRAKVVFPDPGNPRVISSLVTSTILRRECVPGPRRSPWRTGAWCLISDRVVCHGRLVHRPQVPVHALVGDPATTYSRGTDTHEERYPPGVQDHRG